MFFISVFDCYLLIIDNNRINYLFIKVFNEFKLFGEELDKISNTQRKFYEIRKNILNLN